MACAPCGLGATPPTLRPPKVISCSSVTQEMAVAVANRIRRKGNLTDIERDVVTCRPTWVNQALAQMPAEAAGASSPTRTMLYVEGGAVALVLLYKLLK